jgi:GDP-L-fucose synthase
MGSILKKYLVTGCSGLVGVKVVNFLHNDKDNFVVGIDIKSNKDNIPIGSDNFMFYNIDITDTNKINALFEEYKFDGVVNCFGIKGSPIRAKEKPLDFLTPSIKGNINIIENCYKHNSFLVFLSSVGVYAPAEVFVEDTVWKTLPSEHDWFPSWSKRIPEIYLEAYKTQHSWDNYCILRPANIFGENDNYGEGSTVIASTIKKVYEAEDNTEIVVWGDGTPTRDFIYANEVAEVCVKCIEDKRHLISNVGCGTDISIKQMVETVIKVSGKNLKIKYDTSKPNGDMKRKMSTEIQKKYNLLPETDFEHGIKFTYKFYKERIAIK